MRHARRKALREADCVLLAGVPCDFRLDYGKHVRRRATLIAANRSAQGRAPEPPARRSRAIGDAGLTSSRRWRQRVRRARARRDDWIAQLRARDAAREAEIDAQAARAGEHVNPVAFFRALERAAGDNAVFVADGGDFVATASLHPAPARAADAGSTPARSARSASAPASRSAPRSRGREREVWLIWGDGACGYGLAEFDTFVRHGIPVIAVVGNDAGWTQIAREQVKMLHDDVGTVLARTAYHEVAPGFGAEGLVVQHARPRCEPALRAGARARAPAAGRCWSTSGSTRPSSARARSRCELRAGFRTRTRAAATARDVSCERSNSELYGSFAFNCSENLARLMTIRSWVPVPICSVPSFASIRNSIRRPSLLVTSALAVTLRPAGVGAR